METIILKLKKSSDYNEIITILKSLTNQELINLRQILDCHYYNSTSSKPLVSDSIYDIFYEYLIHRIPSQKNIIGCKINIKNKVELPFWMGSLNKKKDEKNITRWISKYTGSYVVSEKLDGVSLLFTKKDDTINLYTRGDGKEGTDITYLYPYLNFPKIQNDISVRGELIISINKFEKYKDYFDNARQMVSGVVNSKTIKRGLEDIDFIAYQIMDTDMSISNQYKSLKNMGFSIPKFITRNTINTDILRQDLLDMKKRTIYNIDGIVITDDKKYTPNTSGNPDYAFAFKMLGNVFQTQVEEVIWELSKNGILKPRIRVIPVNVGDVVITYITGNNARNIIENGIGRGAIVNITRSGDVIPHIVEVVKKTIPEMPKEKYHWNESKVDIVAELKNQDNRFCIKYLTELLNALGVLNVGDSTVRKIYDDGYDTLEKILNCNNNSFQHIEGLGTVSSKKICENIKTAVEKNFTVSKIIGVSNILGFGIGEKRVMAILDIYPDIFTENTNRTREEYKNMIMRIKGFSHIIAKKIALNILWAKKLIVKYGKWIITPTKIKTGKFKNYNVVFSGFRDKQLQEYIIKEGGLVSDTISSKITHLIVKDTEAQTTKTQKAKKLGIEIISLKKFLEI